jgi:hypothetical protein
MHQSQILDDKSVSNFQHLVEPEGSVSCSQETANDAPLASHESSTYSPNCFLKIYFNTIRGNPG